MTRRLHREVFETVAPIDALALSPEGDALALATPGGVSIRAVGKAPNHVHVEAGSVSALAWSSDRRHLAVVTRDQVQLLDATSGATRGALAHRAASSLAFDPDGRMLAVGEADGAISVWRVDENALVARWHAFDARVRSLVFCRDRPWVAALGDTRAADARTADDGIVAQRAHAPSSTVRVFRWDDGERVLELDAHEAVRETCLQFAPMGTALTIASAGARYRYPLAPPPELATMDAQYGYWTFVGPTRTTPVWLDPEGLEVLWVDAYGALLLDDGSGETRRVGELAPPRGAAFQPQTVIASLDGRWVAGAFQTRSGGGVVVQPVDRAT